MPPLILARNAMATRFEFVLAGGDPAQLRAAGEEALHEVERIENQLSIYRPGSEIAQVNALAATQPVRVSPPVFQLLARARQYSALCGGAFDISVAPLVRCWGFMRSSGAPPTDESLREARAAAGLEHLQLDERNLTVRFLRPGMMLDLGAIGKGYALDQAAELLRENGVEQALLHGGTSTILALGSAPEGGGWKVALERPSTEFLRQGSAQAEGAEPDNLEGCRVIELANEALSVSAVWGKYFVLDGKAYGHVIDPRTGRPAEGALMGAVLAASAEESDAFSTAVLLASDEDLSALGVLAPGLRWLQIRSGEDGLVVRTRGMGGNQTKPQPLAG